MALQIKEGTRVKVKKVVKVEERYTVVHFSSSDKRYGSEDEYDYSNWGYGRLVGRAHSGGVNEGDVLSLKGAKVSFVQYKKDGEWTNPSSPQLVVFDFELYSGKGKPVEKVEEMPVIPDEDEIPF